MDNNRTPVRRHVDLDMASNPPTRMRLRPPEKQRITVKLEMLKSIHETADGVILWVVLVLDSLYQVARVETAVISDKLFQYVDSLPNDLKGFSGQMDQTSTSTILSAAHWTAHSRLMWINVAGEIARFPAKALCDALAITTEWNAQCPEAEALNVNLDQR